MKGRGKSRHNQQPVNSWRRVMMVRKWLKLAATDSDYSADSDSCSGSDSEPEKDFCHWPNKSELRNDDPDQTQVNANEALPRLRRRKSETFRAQYINNKEIRVCATTWNVGGISPPDDIDLDSLLDITEPADVYVIGLQEIIPLNAGHIFGAEDSRPVSKWENVIREALNRVPPATKFKSFSNPPSPSRFKPSEDAPVIEDEIVLESDSDVAEEIFPLNDDDLNDLHETNNNNNDFFKPVDHQSIQSPLKKLNRSNCLRIDDPSETMEASNGQYTKKLTKTLSGTERMGLCWPERPLHLLPQQVLEKPNPSFNASKSFGSCSSYKSKTDAPLLSDLDLESVIYRRRRPSYVKIVSKQMVGILIMIWVRRSLRKHIQNLNVSTVGVGIMGYIGNKGSVAVSMSIHQTLCCFICTHLTAGERDSDAVKRNADVHEIHKRTRFNQLSSIGLPRRIYDHERIIWLGDLNYRINLSYEQTIELIYKREWSKLVEKDQLMRELKKDHVFDGWSEGTLSFAPTYKYHLNSEAYFGVDPKLGRRTPAWCDRILSFGGGMRLVRYKRSEVKLSDHRPVTASYMVEVEVFSPKKLQRALTFTDAEVEAQDIGTNGIGHQQQQVLYIGSVEEEVVNG
ncbi:type IV inositol polyphosphate 5-phosphatase 3-like [Andrographis paniculata]|uniref:type IV inositol polyphosphate 5-phosphatase 3-like n=1 Tax=Andrographis paniculata TaxID=175694 RepID=UPI0021E909AB|nr:type IV inositol polyphosphate 5-phosphatase 3-like [Andrographis paniculata]